MQRNKHVDRIRPAAPGDVACLAQRPVTATVACHACVDVPVVRFSLFRAGERDETRCVSAWRRSHVFAFALLAFRPRSAGRMDA